MKNKYRRREFIKTSAIAGIGLGLSGSAFPIHVNKDIAEGGKIGMIGLDTSHVVAFTETINNQSAAPEFSGYKVVAAYPTEGSADMPSSINRLDRFTNNLSEMGIEIVNSISELLEKVDVVLLESVDGRRHLSEALPVLKAGKRMFIDKPLSNDLTGAIAICEASKKYKVPVFSCSSTRFTPITREIALGDKIGQVLGANTYCPSKGAVGHLDLAFYGIHAIESLFTLMGTGCKEVVRPDTSDTQLAIGTWKDDRVGVFRGIPSDGKSGFGATVFGSEGIEEIQILSGYKPMLVQVVEYFRTGIVPFSPGETLEIFAFMAAADESKLRGGAPVALESVMQQATEDAKELIS